MIFRPILGIPILIVGLGLGAAFALPVLMASIQVDQPVKVCRPVLATNLKNADAVLTGQVEAVLQEGKTADVWITPMTWYKGTAGTGYLHLVANASAPTETSKELRFATGQPPYLLFLRRVPDGRYQTSLCAGSRSLGTGLTEAEQKAFAAIKAKP